MGTNQGVGNCRQRCAPSGRRSRSTKRARSSSAPSAPRSHWKSFHSTQANGRVLAQDVVSNVDVPPFSRAAMDGYAVRAEDTTGASPTTPRTLQRIETIFTGQVPQRHVGPGECAEIATGAPMPDGADAVVMVEETDIDERGVVSVFAQASARQNIGRQGADIQKGQRVLRAGHAAQREPARFDRGARPDRGRGLCEADGRHSVHRQRDRRSGPAARTRTDLRHQPRDRLRRGVRQRRYSDPVSHGVRHDRGPVARRR